jgi:type VI secretion system protein ImpH
MANAPLESVLRALAPHAHRVPFFALVRHLERLLGANARVGGLGPLAAERIRFRHDIRPIFHASDVTHLRVVGSGDQLRVTVTTGFLGVVGSVSPLANYFTDDVLRAESIDEQSLRAFYDLFHHRLIAFVYGAELRASAWAEIREDGGDRITRRSLLFAGAGDRPGSVGGLAPTQWLGLARVVGRRPHTRDALEAALAIGFPSTPIRVVDFMDRSIELPIDVRSQLGVKNVELGRGARLGARLVGQTGLLRLSVGPVDRAGFNALLPGTPDHARLRAIVDTVTGGLLDADAEIEVRAGEEPRARLGGRHGTRLGVNALIVRPRADRPLRIRVALTDDAGAGRPAFAVGHL